MTLGLLGPSALAGSALPNRSTVNLANSTDRLSWALPAEAGVAESCSIDLLLPVKAGPAGVDPYASAPVSTKRASGWTSRVEELLVLTRFSPHVSGAQVEGRPCVASTAHPCECLIRRPVASPGSETTSRSSPRASLATCCGSRSSPSRSRTGPRRSVRSSSRTVPGRTLPGSSRQVPEGSGQRSATGSRPADRKGCDHRALASGGAYRRSSVPAGASRAAFDPGGCGSRRGTWREAAGFGLSAGGEFCCCPASSRFWGRGPVVVSSRGRRWVEPPWRAGAGRRDHPAG